MDIVPSRLDGSGSGRAIPSRLLRWCLAVHSPAQAIADPRSARRHTRVNHHPTLSFNLVLKSGGGHPTRSTSYQPTLQTPSLQLKEIRGSSERYRTNMSLSFWIVPHELHRLL